jgi:RNA polymerase sigma factor (sigma-70 family)
MSAADDPPLSAPKFAANPAAFPATRLSVCEAVRSADPEKRRIGWSTLVEAYWKPVCKYVRLKWRTDADEAADLTQEFFARALEKGFFVPFDPARARFRTFLRVCLDGFVANQRQAAARLKRGGGVAPLSLDGATSERGESGAGRSGERSPVVATAPDELEEIFHREWVRSIFEAALTDLKELCDREGRQRHFELFKRRDLDDADAERRPGYAELARESGLPVTTVTNHLAWARRTLRERVLARLRALCASEEEFRDEARALLGVAP